MSGKENTPSALLSQEENNSIFQLLGSMKQVGLEQAYYNYGTEILPLIVKVKCATVAQIFHAYPERTQWKKFMTGVLCYVKDSTRLSYFICLIDLAVRTELLRKGCVFFHFPLDYRR